MGSKLLLALAVTALLGAGLFAAPAPARAEVWCGTETSADQADTVGGNLVHVVYAMPSDGPDRFGERASAIATDISMVANWWRLQDPAREPRFDLASIPNCSSRFGQLDISSIRIAEPAAAFASPDGRFQRLLSSLTPSLTSSDKKYLIYFESPVNFGGDICGTAFTRPRSGGLSGSGAIWLAPNLYGLPGCGTIGNGGYVASTAAHELIHALGALDSTSVPGPPHPCPGDPGHPCDSRSDLLSPNGFSEFLVDYALDVGKDDYYGHSGTWWDVQDSAWLTHLNAPLRRVTVAISGGADAQVRSSPPGLACPPLCAQEFDGDLPIELTATEGEGWTFVGWSGSCSGKSCTVPLNTPAAITARFTPLTWKIAVRVAGRGRVTSRPRGVVTCPGRCRSSIAYKASVRLVATPAPGYRFVGWRGDCAGRRACLVMGADASVTANFRR